MKSETQMGANRESAVPANWRGPRARTGTYGAEDVARESGFALVIALLAIVCLTGLATGGWLLSNSERQISHNHSAAQVAFYAADAGLQQYVAEHQGGTPDTSVTYAYSPGKTDVTARQITEIDDYHSVWEISSIGSYDVPGGGTARRTVSGVAMLNGLVFKFDGAFTSASGLDVNGSSATISGNDEATSTDCPVGGSQNVAGASVPGDLGTDGYTQSGTGQVLYGEPELDETKTQLEVAEATGIPWREVIDGQALRFDYRIAPDSWPDYTSMSSSEQPIVYVDNEGGEFDLPSSGWGTLIVRGDLDMNGHMEWKGPIIVGGAVNSDGKQTVRGGIISGLNVLLGESVPRSSVGNGTKEFLYNSCFLLDAMKDAATFVEEPGTWYESI